MHHTGECHGNPRIAHVGDVFDATSIDRVDFGMER